MTTPERATKINNRIIMAKRLRDIAAMILKRKYKQAWHALIAFADQLEESVK